MKQDHMKRGFSLAMFLLYTAGAHGIILTPTYTHTVGDAVTGSNFIPSVGWYVTPGADEYINDLNRERPLGTNGFSDVVYQGSNYWVQKGKYYSYLDIVSGQWGYDDRYLYFKQTLYGNWDMDNPTDSKDYGVFGSGTLYNIILGQRTDQETNGSTLLRVSGDEKKSWAGTSDNLTGQFVANSTEGFWDSTGDVGGTGITNTNQGTSGGYDLQAILSGGYLLDSNNPQVLFSRITGATLTDNSQPYVEIAFDYYTWNLFRAYADPDLPLFNPDLISLVVFEANRGTKDRANYLWNDEWTQSEEGSPYNIAGITQLGNVYELDRVFWHYTENGDGDVPIPVPSTFILLGAGLAGLVARRRKKQGL